MYRNEEPEFVESSKDLVASLASIYEPDQAAALIAVDAKFSKAYQEMPDFLHNTLLSPFRIKLAGLTYLDMLEYWNNAISDENTTGIIQLMGEILHDIERATLDDEIDDELFEECMLSVKELICGYEIAVEYQFNASELREVRLCAHNLPDMDICAILKYFSAKDYQGEDATSEFVQIRLKLQNDYYAEKKAELEEYIESHSEDWGDCGEPIEYTEEHPERPTGNEEEEE